ncbi:MAG TPA: hypothetical protein VFF69_08290 [Phycisphaerales bacterium]|nr:hypothetical protein [Phycisphaerales bacterium]
MPTPDPRPLDDVLTDLRSFLDTLVAAGFSPPDEMLQSAIECYEDELAPDALRPHAERMLRESLDAHAAAQASWPQTTDCDRLDAALAELESRGIFARQNYWCCGTCGCAAIDDEMQQAAARGAQVRGYTFYHEQDTDSAVEDGSLYLNYGSADHPAGPQAAVAIGEEVRDTLERHGLSVHWDGTIERRIGVVLDWKRRSLA